MLAVISGGEGEDISFSLGNDGGGGGEGRRWHTGTGSVDGGERQCRRDSAMETDTACDLGDVVLGGGGGGGGVAGEEGGGERGALRCKLFWREE